MKKRTVFLSALLFSTGLFYMVPKAISGPTMMFSFRDVGIVSKKRCINAAYSVISSNGLTPAYDAEYDGDAQFAPGRDLNNSVIIDCTHSDITGQVMVIASSYKNIKYEYVKDMVDEVYDLLNY